MALQTVEQRVVEVEKDVTRNAHGIDLANVRLEALDQKMDRQHEATNQRFAAIDQRFLGIDQRFLAQDDKMDRQYEAVLQRFEAMDRKHEALSRKIDQQFWRFVGVVLVVQGSVLTLLLNFLGN